MGFLKNNPMQSVELILRGAAHPVINIRTSEHHIFSRPLLSVRMFGSWGKKRANASSNCAAL